MAQPARSSSPVVASLDSASSKDLIWNTPRDVATQQAIDRIIEFMAAHNVALHMAEDDQVLMVALRMAEQFHRLLPDEYAVDREHLIQNLTTWLADYARETGAMRMKTVFEPAIAASHTGVRVTIDELRVPYNHTDTPIGTSFITNVRDQRLALNLNMKGEVSAGQTAANDAIYDRRAPKTTSTRDTLMLQALPIIADDQVPLAHRFDLDLLETLGANIIKQADLVAQIAQLADQVGTLPPDIQQHLAQTVTLLGNVLTNPDMQGPSASAVLNTLTTALHQLAKTNALPVSALNVITTALHRTLPPQSFAVVAANLGLTFDHMQQPRPAIITNPALQMAVSPAAVTPLSWSMRADFAALHAVAATMTPMRPATPQSAPRMVVPTISAYNAQVPQASTSSSVAKASPSASSARIIPISNVAHAAAAPMTKATLSTSQSSARSTPVSTPVSSIAVTVDRPAVTPTSQPTTVDRASPVTPGVLAASVAPSSPITEKHTSAPVSIAVSSATTTSPLPTALPAAHNPAVPAAVQPATASAASGPVAQAVAPVAAATPASTAGSEPTKAAPSVALTPANANTAAVITPGVVAQMPPQQPITVDRVAPVAPPSSPVTARVDHPTRVKESIGKADISTPTTPPVKETGTPKEVAPIPRPKDPQPEKPTPTGSECPIKGKRRCECKPEFEEAADRTPPEVQKKIDAEHNRSEEFININRFDTRGFTPETIKKLTNPTGGPIQLQPNNGTPPGHGPGCGEGCSHAHNRAAAYNPDQDPSSVNIQTVDSQLQAAVVPKDPSKPRKPRDHELS